MHLRTVGVRGRVWKGRPLPSKLGHFFCRHRIATKRFAPHTCARTTLFTPLAAAIRQDEAAGGMCFDLATQQTRNTESTGAHRPQSNMESCAAERRDTPPWRKHRTPHHDAAPPEGALGPLRSSLHVDLKDPALPRVEVAQLRVGANARDRATTACMQAGACTASSRMPCKATGYPSKRGGRRSTAYLQNRAKSSRGVAKFTSGVSRDYAPMQGNKSR